MFESTFRCPRGLPNLKKMQMEKEMGEAIGVWDGIPTGVQGTESLAGV